MSDSIASFNIDPPAEGMTLEEVVCAAVQMVGAEPNEIDWNKSFPDSWTHPTKVTVVFMYSDEPLVIDIKRPGEYSEHFDGPRH